MSDYDTILFYYYFILQYSPNDSSILCDASGRILITTTPIHYTTMYTTTQPQTTHDQAAQPQSLTHTIFLSRVLRTEYAAVKLPLLTPTNLSDDRF